MNNIIKLLFVSLIFLLSILSIYSAGTTYCAPITSEGRLELGTVGKKFNPGHYMKVTAGYHNGIHDQRINALHSQIQNYGSDLKGFQVYYYWSQLENTEGDYNFDLIQDVLDIAEQHDKHIWLYLNERSFSSDGCSGKKLVPQYIHDAGYMYADAVAPNGRCMPELWNPNYVDKYIKFLKALGEEFDHHPNLELVSMGETALGYPMGGSYDREEYFNQMVRILEETKDSYKNTILISKVNYMSGNERRYIDEGLVPNGVALGWPDPFPCRQNCDRPESHKWAIENPNMIPLTPHVDTWETYFHETQDIFDYYVDEIGVNHIVWTDYYTSIYQNQPDGATYVTNELIPMLRRNNHRINTQCPSITRTCLDTSDSCNGNSNPPTSNSNDGRIVCNQLFPTSSEIPSGYGASYDLDSDKLIVDAKCDSNNINFEVGERDSNMYVYENAYVWKNNNWEKISLGGERIGDSSWFLGEAYGGVGEIDTSENNYVLGYVCKWTGSKWKCGCRDSSCSQNFWNLQIAKK